MTHIGHVLQIVEEVAWPNIGIAMSIDPGFLEVRIARKFGRRALTQIGEDQAQIFVDRVGAQSHLVAERHGLRRLLDASALAVEFPAVIEAANPIALYLAGGKQHGTVWTARLGQAGYSVLTTIQIEVLAHDADRPRTASRQFGRVEDRLPEQAQIASSDGAGLRRADILLADAIVVALGTEFCHAWRRGCRAHLSPPKANSALSKSALSGAPQIHRPGAR